MLFVVFTYVVLLATTGLSASIKDINITNTCDAPIERYSNCTGRVESVDGCTSAFVNFTNTPSAQCTAINYLWTQPADNLTMILETSFTKADQAYKINFDNYSLLELVTHVYQIINNQEIEVTTHTSTLTLPSDSNYQVIVKFETPAQSTVSAIDIRYEAVKS